MYLKNNIRDSKIRNSYKLTENLKILSNFILKSSKIKKKFKHFFFKNYFDTKNTLIKSKKRCTFTGRSRSCYGFARMSRIFLRENFFVNKIPGLQKSYW
jgi:ribosomal protein S14